MSLQLKGLKDFEEQLATHASKETVRVYTHAVTHYLASLDGNVQSRRTAQTYLDSLTANGKSPSTVALRAHAITAWFAYKGESVSLNSPTIRLGEPKYLVYDDVLRLLANCETLLEKVLITMLFDTAVRISELLNLETRLIDHENNTITVVRKGGRRSEINMSNKAVVVLDEWLARLQASNIRSDRVFPGVSYWMAWFTVKRAGMRCGLTVTPHVLRHSRAIQMLKSGAHLYVVSQHLGHKSISTTADIYGQFAAADLRPLIPKW